MANKICANKIRVIFALCAIFGANLACIFALDFSDSNIAFKNLDLQNLSTAENIEKFAVSEKFDGVRGIWDGRTMFSKRGKKLAIPPCFAEKLAVLNLQNGEFVEGEFWTNYGDFEKISSLIRRKNPTCADFDGVKFLIFNAHLNESSDFLANLTRISSSLMGDKNAKAIQKTAQIQVIAQHKFTNANEVVDFFNAVVAKGGEGVILRDSHTAFKLKAQHDAECKIIDYTRGKGRLNGKIGAIICESLADKNAGIRQGAIFRIGSGMDDKMRENPPKIGTIISYKFSGVTRNGLPKHTRFWRVREE